MTTLVRLRDRGVAAFDAAVLQFGTYDLSARTPSGRLIADEYFIQAYAGSAPDRTHPDLSPSYADLAGMPRVYPASPHGFTGHATPVAAAARDDLRDWLRHRCGAVG